MAAPRSESRRGGKARTRGPAIQRMRWGDSTRCRGATWPAANMVPSSRCTTLHESPLLRGPLRRVDSGRNRGYPRPTPWPVPGAVCLAESRIRPTSRRTGRDFYCDSYPFPSRMSQSSISRPACSVLLHSLYAIGMKTCPASEPQGGALGISKAAKRGNYAPS